MLYSVAHLKEAKEHFDRHDIYYELSVQSYKEKFQVSSSFWKHQLALGIPRHLLTNIIISKVLKV